MVSSTLGFWVFHLGWLHTVGWYVVFLWPLAEDGILSLLSLLHLSGSRCRYATLSPQTLLPGNSPMNKYSVYMCSHYHPGAALTSTLVPRHQVLCSLGMLENVIVED